MKLRTLLEGAGVGILLTIALWWSQLSPLSIYHRLLPVNSIAGGVLIDLLIATLVCAAVFTLVDQHLKTLKPLFWLLVCVLFEIKTIRTLQALEIIRAPRRSEFVVAALLLALGFALWQFHRSWFLLAIRLFRAGLVLIGMCIFWAVPELIYLTLHKQPIESWSYVHPAVAGASVPSSRIVWILFDELSYNLTYDHPQPSVPMPTFQALKATSVVFSDVRPTGYYTQLVIPSLFLGRRAEAIRSSLDGQPSFRFAGQAGWHAFEPQETVFADAAQAGWTTAIAGWYNPYCRLFPDTLNSCYWTMGGDTPLGLSNDKPASTNALWLLQLQIGRLWNALSGEGKDEAFLQKSSITDYQDLQMILAQGDSLLKDESLRMIFLHLAAPHPPGMYDRKSHHAQAGGTYLDNLVLADDTLRHLLEVLNATPSASSTTLIVSSDHSWRVPMWRSQDGWTREEEEVSQGKFDDRPVLLIHFPGQTSGKAFTQPFDELRTHDILQQMLQHPGFSASDLDNLLDSKSQSVLR